MDPHLRDLRYFLVVAAELSFTRAAAGLHVSQPALSKQVRVLEASLGVELFDRSHRQIALTPAGIALRETASRLLEGWDEGVVVARAAAERDVKRLVVGTLTSIGRDLYPRITDGFNGRHPGCQVELRSYSWLDSSAGLRGETSDVAFLWLPVDGTGISFEVLSREARYVALSDGHALADREELEFAELLGERFVALPREAGEPRGFWLGADHPGGRPRQRIIEVSSADETFEIVSSGGAIALLAAGNATLYSRPGVRCIPVTDLAPARLAIAWREADRRGVVADFVREATDAAESNDSITAARK
jgi:DNA-binding transcriptional LysR family regulator